jgi:hypothetical protein
MQNPAVLAMVTFTETLGKPYDLPGKENGYGP